jgi:putative ATP-binding cassette transporter
MQRSPQRMLFISALAGISTTAILFLINAAASSAEEGNSTWHYAVLFVVALVIFFKTQQYILVSATVEIEMIIHKLRIGLMDQVRRSELLALDTIGRAAIVNAITRETQMMRQAAEMLGFVLQGAVLIVFVAAYIGYLSVTALVLTLTVMILAIPMFRAAGKRLTEEQFKASEWDHRLFDRLSDLLDGFKEVRLNRGRSEALFDDIVQVSRAGAELKIQTQTETFRNLVLVQSSVYMLIGILVFAVPTFSSSAGSSMQKIATALLFVAGAFWGAVQFLPILLAADAAARNAERLEQQLRATVVSELGARAPVRRFETIELRDVSFHYREKSSDTAFRIGPINFTLRSGELVFIMGGNGSGKSTLFKVLAGLYKPDSGQILLDGRPIVDSNREAYRSLMTAIFADYHLFHRLYGIFEPDMGRIRQLLTELGLADKTQVVDDEFKTVELSTGQRKRLGLIVSLLEKRPILLLDEWPAEQDPEYRRKFYHDLLPEFIRAGLTVVAISHDDRYIDEAHLRARVIRMEEGRVVDQRSLEPV